jgi:aminoglycoside phosphotransferase (APT) family kinase protein
VDLAPRLRGVLGVDRIEGLRRLSGGASRETWSFDATAPDGTMTPLIARLDVRRDARVRAAVPERRLLDAAAEAGVPVPAVIAEDDELLVMARIEGETIPRRILRDDAYAGARPKLAAQCGEALAAIHRIPVESVPGLDPSDQVTQFREVLDGFGQPHPAFELAFRWLDENRPPPTGSTSIVHGDFRNGNLIVGPDGLSAVLDWELAHLGDPMEDLGWLCVRAWRFGVDDRPVGGFGTYDELFDAYAAASGRAVDPHVVRWWEVLGTLKWGIMCMVQAWAHLGGTVRSVELATIGRRVCENEWDVLELIAPATGSVVPRAHAVHDRPTVHELVGAVREFLDNDVRAATEGRVQFHARVASNALAIVERQLAADLPEPDLSSEADLAMAIREGRAPADVAEQVRSMVAGKLAVAHPGYSGPAGRKES